MILRLSSLKHASSTDFTQPADTLAPVSFYPQFSGVITWRQATKLSCNAATRFSKLSVYGTDQLILDVNFYIIINIQDIESKQ